MLYDDIDDSANENHKINKNEKDEAGNLTARAPAEKNIRAQGNFKTVKELAGECTLEGNDTSKATTMTKKVESRGRTGS